MSRTSLTALALATTALAAAGCGGSSKPAERSPSGQAANTLTSAELIAKADAVCKRVNGELASTLAIKSRRDYGVALPRIAAKEQAAVAELVKLTPPASMAADWRQIVTADKTLASYTGIYGQYLSSNDFRAARALMRAATGVLRPMVATAKRDGFTDCTQFAS